MANRGGLPCSAAWAQDGPAEAPAEALAEVPESRDEAAAEQQPDDPQGDLPLVVPDPFEGREITSLAVEGARRYSEDRLRAALGLRAGDAYSTEKVEQGIGHSSRLVDLVFAGLASHLIGGLGEPQHAGSSDRVR